MKISTAVAMTGVFLFATAMAPSALAQEGSLAGLAEKTRKEREEEKADPKVISADDLRNTRSQVYVPPGSATSAATAPASEGGGDESSGEASSDGEEEKTPAQLRSEQSAELRGQMAQQQERLTRLQEQQSDTQRQLADQSTFYPGSNRRAALEQLLEKVNTEIADAQRQIADIQRRARSLGVSLR